MKHIPKIIHQIYTHGWQTLPDEIKNQIKDLRQKNPAWEYRFYDENDIIRYVSAFFGQDMLDLYLCINPEYGAVRADLFRYLVIYNEGGIYLDIKSFCTRPLDEIVTRDCELILCHWDNGVSGVDHKKGLHPELSHLSHGEYQQWHIIAAPGSPYLKCVIREVTTRLQDYKPWKYGIGMRGVLRTSGPIAYTLAINSVQSNCMIKIVDNHRNIGLVYCNVDKLVLKKIRKSAYARLQSPIVKLSNSDYYKYRIWLFFIYPIQRLKKNCVNETLNVVGKVKNWLSTLRNKRAALIMGVLMTTQITITALHILLDG
ncbi:glycosyltransferase family 32 protein [Leclercia sp.]|uniref:glycosyltransferase family 32 protein n=1 Tax=Leclercia sp. TaxID=1898428 RepID=UPI0028967B98|nr:glycosyltransferase [Leclercia sp.]